MALADDQLFSSQAGKGAEIRMFPRKNKVGTLAAQTGAPTLPKGTPLAYNTSTNLWTVFTQGGSNGEAVIRGFLMDVDGVATSATEEVQVVIMLEGDVHRDDINTTAIRAVLGGSANEAQVDTALQAQLLRELSLHVQGLINVS